jgi:hypothetical protein
MVTEVTDGGGLTGNQSRQLVRGYRDCRAFNITQLRVMYNSTEQGGADVRMVQGVEDKVS